MPQISNLRKCSECPGFCCKLFFLPTSEKEMQDRLKEKELEVKTLSKKMANTHSHSLGFLHKLRDAVQVLEMLAFGCAHFVRVPDVVRDDDGEPCGEGNFISGYSYTCDQWNPDTGKCMSYDTRPWTCESFVCDPVFEGRTPTRKDFPYSAQLTNEQAEKIVELRNTPMATIMAEEKEIPDVQPR